MKGESPLVHFGYQQLQLLAESEIAANYWSAINYKLSHLDNLDKANEKYKSDCYW